MATAFAGELSEDQVKELAHELIREAMAEWEKIGETTEKGFTAKDWEYRGQNPPEGAQLVSTGPRGGKIYRVRGDKPSSTPEEHKEAEYETKLLKVLDLLEDVKDIKSDDDVKNLTDKFMKMDLASIKKLAKDLGVEVESVQQKMAAKQLAQRALASVGLVPKPWGEQENESGSEEGSGASERPPTEDRGPVEEEAGGTANQTTGESGADVDKPAGDKTDGRIPAEIDHVNKKIDRYERLFRATGQHQVADWMGMLRNHVNQVGVEDALEALGEKISGEGEEVQYAGFNLEGKHDKDFVESYLDRNGISLTWGSQPEGELRAISTVTPSSDAEGTHSRGDARDVFPTLQTLRDKLHEAQHLPGLESSEDLSKLMGGEFGAKVDSFYPAMVGKLNEKYGEGQWIVKSYGDEAYAGYGIFFPQRVQQLQQEARNLIWSAGEQVAKHGFTLDRENGKIVGLKHNNGDVYRFGTEKYNNVINGDVRHWADMVANDRITTDPKGNKINVGSPANSEQATAIPEGKFMAQPAFPVVGITNEDRAAGITFKKGQEGRVHITTRNGKAEIIPHSTWLKDEPIPVVFEDADTRAMAQAALDAINALPESERGGQLYAPDIVRTANGFRVVEANPANEAGASGYLQDAPLVVDSYVSHITGREPAHVRFIRNLLSRRKRK